MKIFILGMPSSGRTTVAKAICEDNKFEYVEATSWVKNLFREKTLAEHINQYQDEYHQWLTAGLKKDQDLFLRKMWHETVDKSINYIIDGIVSPRDLIQLFNHNEDIIIFLNRTDNDSEYKDYENIGISVMRDYCFWMSSAGLLNKDNWLEFNFKINEEETDSVKKLGSKNTVLIVKSINSVIKILKKRLNDLSSGF